MTRLGLVIGGTGMLAGTVAALADRGWTLLTPGRRPRPTAGRFLRADWSDPAAFAERVGCDAMRPVDLLVAWVHEPQRQAVLTALGPLLHPDTPVVEVWASASADPLATLPAPALTGHRTHRVVLGYQRDGGGRSRWLSDSEISDGVTAAVTAALAHSPPTVHEVGRLRPWAEHP